MGLVTRGRHGSVGRDWPRRTGKARRGLERYGIAGVARTGLQGMARKGEERQAWPGLTAHGVARHCAAGVAWIDGARHRKVLPALLQMPNGSRMGA